MFKEEFRKSVEKLQEELQVLQISRANPQIIENIQVAAYNATMQVQELATILTPNPQTLLVQPWDKSNLAAIEIALRKNEQHFNVVVDRDAIRIAFPQLTEERRKELVKIMRQKVEQARISIRQKREEELKKIKEMQKEGQISEDDYWRQEKEIQRAVDEVNKEMETISTAREKEIMTI